MSLWSNIGAAIKDITNVFNKIDTDQADANIRGNILFRGPNVWILACSIIIACTGLNINSTAVIIGAMLISPLLGPIFGFGMGLGITDTRLIRSSLVNLAVMVLVSVTVATLFFLVSPLTLVNPTELEARTNPSIYDVLIALFGGIAGVLEMSRREKGVVLSGVAIATAIMPPLCTAGYGLAHLNMHFFLGAMYLFFINFLFITLATYVMVKYLRFHPAEIPDPRKAKRARHVIAAVIIIFTIPSLWSAANMIQSNNFILKARSFLNENKSWDRSYIYDYEIDGHKGGRIDIYFAGDPLKSHERESMLAIAKEYGITEDQITIHEQVYEDEPNASDSEILMKGIYERTDLEINRREAQIKILEDQLREYRSTEIPYTQITQEVRSQYPDIKNLYLTRGASVRPAAAPEGEETEAAAPGLDESRCILIVAETGKPLQSSELERLENWLKIRLNDPSVIVINRY